MVPPPPVSLPLRVLGLQFLDLLCLGCYAIIYHEDVVTAAVTLLTIMGFPPQRLSW